MTWFIYLSLGFVIGLWVLFLGGMIVAGAIDWYNYRRNRVFIELQRDHNERRRPAAK